MDIGFSLIFSSEFEAWEPHSIFLSFRIIAGAQGDSVWGLKMRDWMVWLQAVEPSTCDLTGLVTVIDACAL